MLAAPKEPQIYQFPVKHMFFNNKPLVIYLTAEYLEIFGTSDLQQHKFQYPTELVQHGEIVNEIKLKDALFQFFNSLVFKVNKGFIILSQKLVFSLEIDNIKNQEEEVNKFLSTVPINKDDVAIIIGKNKSRLDIYASNKKLFELVISLLKEKNIQIYSVAPLNTFAHKPMTQDLTSQDLKGIEGEGKIMQQYNFLDNKESANKKDFGSDEKLPIQENPHKSMKKQYVMLFISLLFFVASVSYLLLWSEVIPSSWFKKSSPVKATKVTPSPTTSLQPSPTLKPIDKSLVSIQILNGSGVEGQAGKVGQTLQDNGYKNITTGNAPDHVANTTLMYDSALSSSDVNSLLKVLKKDFLNVEVQEASTSSAKYDVVIITGKITQ